MGKQSTCDLNRVRAYLDSDHVHDDSSGLAEHLESCESCRKAIEEMAADSQTWRHAAELLQPTTFDTAGPIEYSACGAETGERESSQAVRSILKLLTPSEDPHRLGRLGPYEVSGVIGIGGMGVVLKAVDPALDRIVAIKVMASHLAQHPTARKRFAREAKAAAAVLHPNVISIHSVSSEDSHPYLVMAYIRGGSLQKRIDREGPLPLTAILRIGSQIAAGLDAAHRQGIVHRDVKPENILLEEGVERVTLTDFGLARSVDDASLTQLGTIAGTPQYMSPEQARGEAVGPTSDLFSLGSVLYTLCTGQPPFRGDSSQAVMRKILDETPRSIRDLNPEIPAWLARLIAKLMEKNPGQRFQSAAQVHQLLEACLSHVQHPTRIDLPPVLDSLINHSTKPNRIMQFGVLVMIALSLVGFGIFVTSSLLSPATPSRLNETSPHQESQEPSPSSATQSQGEPQSPGAPSQEETPLTWEKLLGQGNVELPADYPTWPLTLIDRFDRSRGGWVLEGKISAMNQMEETAVDAKVDISGGFVRPLERGRLPSWSLEIQWPQAEPTHTLRLVAMAVPAPETVKLMLAAEYAENGVPVKLVGPDRPALFAGQWDAESQLIQYSETRPNLPFADPDPKREFRIALLADGSIEIRNFPLSDELRFSGKTTVRVGKPFVEAPGLTQLPGGYQIFSASQSEVYLRDPQGELVGPRIAKLGTIGSWIFGMAIESPEQEEPKTEETGRYFMLNSENGKLTIQMSAEDWNEALREVSINEPRLSDPHEFGPQF